ncbi:DUF969 domain-containing protein [Metaclostridioides mangenotii]|uniref:DUF969 domain-containing protein n=1 Tax=Metaclostridioides mangenotii TaxID=1540 RepID=UPI0028ECC500|nr:DUF969 domain-containing protein [Clostridioides mangenotii]
MIKLIGILIIVVGFALKFNSIAIVMAAGIVTGLVGGMSITDILTTLGETYVANRYMAIFIITLPVVGVLEKNGLKQVAGDLVKKMSKATPGILAIGYTIIRGFLAAFNVSFGGVAGFIRPVISPMSEASVEKYGKKLEPRDLDEIKGMNSAAENVSWFFGQVLFIAGSGILLVKSTLDPVGYTIDPVAAVRAEVPVFIIAVIVSAFFFMMTDRKIMKKYKK